MIRHARPLTEYRRAQRVRQAADAVLLVALFAVILAACLIYGAPSPY